MGPASMGLFMATGSLRLQACWFSKVVFLHDSFKSSFTIDLYSVFTESL